MPTAEPQSEHPARPRPDELCQPGERLVRRVAGATMRSIDMRSAYNSCGGLQALAKAFGIASTCMNPVRPGTSAKRPSVMLPMRTATDRPSTDPEPARHRVAVPEAKDDVRALVGEQPRHLVLALERRQHRIADADGPASTDQCSKPVP